MEGSLTQFRTLLTEFLGDPRTGNSVPRQPNRLPIAGQLDQHLYDQVTPSTGATAPDSGPSHRTFMVEVIDITDATPEDEKSVLEPGPPAMIPGEQVAPTSVMDRGIHTDAWMGKYRSLQPTPNRGNGTFEEVLTTSQALMMTVEEEPSLPLLSSTDTRPLPKRSKQLAQLLVERRTLVDPQQTTDEEEDNPTIEYTVSFKALTTEDFQSGYGTITLKDIPSATEYCSFIHNCRQERDILDRNLRLVETLVFQRHKELFEYAQLLKDQYENTYSLYQVEHPNFIFRYDTTKCCKPKDDLDTGDIRYSIQMAQYYLDLKLHLDEAYRIHKRCVYYHNQIQKFKKRAATLGNSLGREGYRKFAETHPYKKIEYAPYTAAYVRAHRNQWARRVYDMETFSNHYTSEGTTEESSQQEPEVSSLTYISSLTQDEYDPFSLDNDDARTLFPDPQDYMCETQLHAYAMPGEDNTHLLDVQLLEDQNSRSLPEVTGSQLYEQASHLALPTLPTQEELWEYARQQIKTYQRRRRQPAKNRKRKAKRTLQREQQAESLLVTDSVDTSAESKHRHQDLIFDSGCTEHMWNHRAHFTSYEPYNNSKLRAACANGTVLEIIGQGDIGPLKNVLFVPGLRHCLISGTALLKQGYCMYLGTVPTVIKESNPDEVLLCGHFSDDLFKISAQAFEQQLGLQPVTCYLHDLSVQPLLQINPVLNPASAVRCAYECTCTKSPGLANMALSAGETNETGTSTT